MVTQGAVKEFPELATVGVPPELRDRIEARIKQALRRLLYEPLLLELAGDGARLLNSAEDLYEAIRKGHVTFSQGAFRGKFTAAISRELRRLGAKFDRKTSSYRIRLEDLPPEVRAAISTSEVRFEERLKAIDRKIAQFLPEEISGKIKLQDIFDRALWKADKRISKTLKAISVLPELPPEQRRRIAEEWTQNMERSIKDFTEEEVLNLRKAVRGTIFAGNRYESMVRTVQRSYGVSAAKARFLARQETNLLMSKFKEVRCESAGVDEYRWRCTAGSPKHPVRPAHKALDGKIFRWDDPPITTEPNEPQRRNNPGEDFNCRCGAIPIVRF